MAVTSQAVPGDDASGDYSDDDEGASHAFMMRKLSVQIAWDKETVSTCSSKLYRDNIVITQYSY